MKRLLRVIPLALALGVMSTPPALAAGQPHQPNVPRELRVPDGYKRVFRAIHGQVNGRLQTSRGQEQQRAIADAKYLFRRLPGVVSPVNWDAWGQQYPEPAGPEDRESVLGLVLSWEGKASAAIAARSRTEASSVNPSTR